MFFRGSVTSIMSEMTISLIHVDRKYIYKHATTKNEVIILIKEVNKV